MAKLTARELVDTRLVIVGNLNGGLNALIHVDDSNARHQADYHDQSQVERGPLFGTTFVAKDLIDVAHYRTRGGSRLFDNRQASHDAVCVARLKAAGAIALGKANMHEMAVGGAVNPWFGQVVNPLSNSHGTGGTSSGSAAAVAAGLCDFSLGTDCGGSNRSVAAACGLYGYKPTNGLIALDGVLPTAPTMDTVGIIAASPELILGCLQALTNEVTSSKELELKGRTFARITNLVASPVDIAISNAIELAFATIKSRGGQVVELRVQKPEELAAAGVSILRYEFAQNYGEKIDKSAESVGPAVHSFLSASRQITKSQYDNALAQRLECQAEWAAMLSGVDGFISPTAPGLAPDLDAEMTSVGSTRVSYGTAGAEFRMWANTIGIPAIAIPVRQHSGLPASVQLAGTAYCDGLLLNLAAALGQAMDEKIAA